MPAKKKIKETSEEGALLNFFCVLGAKLRADLSRAKKSVPKARFSRVLGKLPWLCNISSLFAPHLFFPEEILLLPLTSPYFTGEGGENKARRSKNWSWKKKPKGKKRFLPHHRFLPREKIYSGRKECGGSRRK